MSADKLPEFDSELEWGFSIDCLRSSSDKMDKPILDAEFAARNLGRLALSLGLDAERMAAMQWQPVETLPKDEAVWILVYADGAMNCMMFYKGEFTEPTHPQHSNIFRDEITHWMPLPQPPKDEQ